MVSHRRYLYHKDEGGKLYVNGELVGEKEHEGEIWVSGGKGRDLALGARNRTFTQVDRTAGRGKDKQRGKGARGTEP